MWLLIGTSDSQVCLLSGEDAESLHGRISCLVLKQMVSLIVEGTKGRLSYIGISKHMREINIDSLESLRWDSTLSSDISEKNVFCASMISSLTGITTLLSKSNHS